MAVIAERVTDTGVLVNGEWLNFSKFGKKPDIKAGSAYEFSTKEFKGRKYIQSAKETPPAVAGTDGGSPQPSTTVTASATNWAAREDDKSRRILVQGVLQACLQSPGLVGFASNIDEYLAAVEAATKREVDFVNAMVR